MEHQVTYSQAHTNTHSPELGIDTFIHTYTKQLQQRTSNNVRGNFTFVCMCCLSQVTLCDGAPIEPTIIKHVIQYSFGWAIYMLYWHGADTMLHNPTLFLLRAAGGEFIVCGQSASATRYMNDKIVYTIRLETHRKRNSMERKKEITCKPHGLIEKRTIVFVFCVYSLKD